MTGRVSALERLTTRVGSNTAARLIREGMCEYFGLVSEVVFEMAFDNMLRFNRDERPMGGGQTFLIAMTLSVTVSGMLQGVSSLDSGVTRLGRIGWSQLTVGQKAVRTATRALLVTSLTLAMAMYAMRIPVLNASEG